MAKMSDRYNLNGETVIEPIQHSENEQCHHHQDGSIETSKETWTRESEKPSYSLIPHLAGHFMDWSFTSSSFLIYKKKMTAPKDS